MSTCGGPDWEVQYPREGASTHANEQGRQRRHNGQSNDQTDEGRGDGIGVQSLVDVVMDLRQFAIAERSVEAGHRSVRVVEAQIKVEDMREEALWRVEGAEDNRGLDCLV